MTTIDTTAGGVPAVPGMNDAAPRQGVNLSDAMQMENTFISLMTAQISNQDPTNPLDSTEFLNQFSAMSQVKSMENMAGLMRNNLVLTDNLQTLSAAALVGSEVSVATERVELGSEPLRGSVQLEHAAGQAVLRLTGMNGTRTEIPLGAQAPGALPFEIDPVAHGLPPGRYLVEVETDAGEYPEVEIRGRVDNVRVTEEGPVLQIAGAGAMPFYRISEFTRSAHDAP